MKNALLKDFIREIKGNKGRFLSIFFIVLLGAAFFSGIRSSGGDMKYTADRYYDETDMMDIRVLSTLGLTDDDLEDIRNVEGVELVEPGMTQDALITNGSDEYVIKVIAKTDDINKLYLTEGRLPQAADECVVDDILTERMGYRIGDKVSLSSGTEKDISESMNISEFTVVGSGKLPYFLDLTRGVGTVGDGQIKGFISVLPEAFDLGVYTEIYVKAAGAKSLNTYSDEYKELVKKLVKRIEAVGETAAVRRYDEVYSEASEKIEDGKKEIADAEKELADAKTELADGRTELDDAKAELDDGKKELDDAKKEIEDGKKELDDGKKELDDAKAEIDSGEKELADAKTEIDNGKKELDDAKAEIDSGETELINSKKQLDDSKKLLDDTKVKLDAGKAELEAQEKTLNEKAAEIEAGWSQYNTQKAEFDIKKAEFEGAKAQYQLVQQQLAAVIAQLEIDPANPELLARKAILEQTASALSQAISQAEPMITAGEAALAEAKVKLEEGDAQIAAGREAIAKARQELEAGEAQYNAGLAQYNDGVKQYEAGLAAWQAGKAEYEAGLAKWQDGKAEYEAGLKEWRDGKAEYEAGLKDYEDGLKEWQDGKKKYEDGLKDYEEGLKEYNDGEKEWADGNAEYIEKAADAEEKIADGKADIADAEKELAKLEEPEWYVLDREKIQSCVSYGGDGERIDKLGNVFPVIFFLVAALVSLTCMTRMVEEQRQQIGTLKALGYGSSRIAFKYIGYALLATVSGAVIGVIVGEIALPTVVLASYLMMYTGLPYYFTPPNIPQGAIAIALSVLCTGGATFAACFRMLMDKPAELMRPEAPKSGRRIILERISFLWKRLNFAQKATLRNLLRYKKRFIMTVLGIGGCMGLMLVGYGLRDSITVIAQNQYIEIFKQDATVTVDTNADYEDIETLCDTIAEYEGLTNEIMICSQSVTLNANNVDRTAFIYVPEDTQRVFDFLRFRDRVSKENLEFPKEGVILSEKTADMLHVNPGDTITIKIGDNGKPEKTTVAGVVENYIQHYAFFSPETYEEIFGEEPEYNEVLLKYSEKTEEFEKKLGTRLLQEKACTSVSFTRELEASIDDMLSTLGLVIWVLIAAAALLAFVVLYNLNSINITERRRELATLKVLGFNDMEVAMYIYRENIILTIIGVIAGALLGKFLHFFTISTIEVDLMMFGREIGWSSYVISGLITAAFSLLVNLVMYYHFKKINMVESLKSVE